MVQIPVKIIQVSPTFTVKSLLIPLLTHPTVAQVIKRVVYLALIVNFAIYIWDDWLAYKSAVASDAPWREVLKQFSTSIDMAAWLGLVFLFEMETYWISYEALHSWVRRAIHGVRIICYASILYAAYGYTATTLDYYDVTELHSLSGLCEVADQGTALQLDTITYAPITSANCGGISAGGPFYRTGDDVSIIDGPTLEHVRRLGWIDVVNAVVWLIVVLLIEVEVRMQAADRFDDESLQPVRKLKTAFYGVLIVDALIWVATGYPLYAWDAFLWIVGFWAIELNLVEWERERRQQLAAIAH